MLDTPRSEVAIEYWLPTPFTSFPFTYPPVRHRVPPGSERALHHQLPLIHRQLYTQDSDGNSAVSVKRHLQWNTDLLFLSVWFSWFSDSVFFFLFIISLDLRFLNFIFFPHLGHRKSFPTPVQSFSLVFVFTTLDSSSVIQWSNCEILKLLEGTFAPAISMMPVWADLNIWEESCSSFIIPDQQYIHHFPILFHIPGIYVCNTFCVHFIFNYFINQL